MAAKPKKSLIPKEQSETQRFLKVIDVVANLVGLLMKCATIGAIVYFATDCIKAFVGQKTDARVYLSLLSDFRIGLDVASLGIGAAGVLYGMKEKKLRERNVRSTADHLRDLEQRLDPRRSSSRLTKDGRTRQEDL